MFEAERRRLIAAVGVGKECGVAEQPFAADTAGETESDVGLFFGE
jgi:hypothetical protein